jgi:hypothetical protein
MANQTDKKTIQKALVGATMLATSPAWAKSDDGISAGGSKSQLGVNHLSLDEFPGNNATICAGYSDDFDNNMFDKNRVNITPNNIAIVFDRVKEDNLIGIEFVVRDIVADNQDYILYLVYSTELSPTPQIRTPNSINKLGLDISALEIVGIMDIPAKKLLAQGSSSLGSADANPYSAVRFSFNFDNNTLPEFIRDNAKVYFQAALLTKSNFNAGNFSEMILSEVDTIEFTPFECQNGAKKIDFILHESDNIPINTCAKDSC